MDGPSLGRPATDATHYQVLNLTASAIENSDAAATLIKRAYHRALLLNHPDKARDSSVKEESLYTVDQISQAFAIISSPAKRAEYDVALRLARNAGNDGELSRFQTGIENVDLDDLEFDEDGERWFRSCRCGNDKGYTFQEQDLEEAQELGELMVGCHDCSLWLKVHFAVLDDDDK
ncbi:hypothetical protein VHEMI10523 [[Torrubiella] hemipterigena]|uniref:Diphthamide biosynthesis protein 4 n=1 Tax=[Torrubiella] hemipterigena TaxID=1531966 RepID=A0A0A1TIX6_9HYPO|nr:hypothetical protein VHEMI10523 [[Torrubiella] hemipterigena]